MWSDLDSGHQFGDSADVLLLLIAGFKIRISWRIAMEPRKSTGPYKALKGLEGLIRALIRSSRAL